MFGIGFSEIIVVLLIIIVFVRPDDLPRFLRTAGRLYGRARIAYNELVSVKDRIIKEIDDAAGLEPSSSAPHAAPNGPASGVESPPETGLMESSVIDAFDVAPERKDC